MPPLSHPVLIETPFPIRTPRLLLRPKQPGDGALTAAAIAETWDDLHRWMVWAERLEDNTAELQEVRTRHVMASLLLREEFNLVGIELATGQPVLWCGLHEIRWPSRQCEIGYWVRKSAQDQGFATEASNALLRYAFGPLGMQRIGIGHAGGNEASRRVIEKLGFTPEGIQRNAMHLPGNRLADCHLYARLNLDGLPELEVTWGESQALPNNPGDDSLRGTDYLATHLLHLEQQLLDPVTRSSPSAVARLLTDDFREFGSSGRTYTRAEILQALAVEVTAHLTLTDFHCNRLTPQTALVTYRSHRTTSDGKTTSALRSSLWLRKDGQWRMHFHQGTTQPAQASTQSSKLPS